MVTCSDKIIKRSLEDIFTKILMMIATDDDTAVCNIGVLSLFFIIYIYIDVVQVPLW